MRSGRFVVFCLIVGSLTYWGQSGSRRDSGLPTSSNRDVFAVTADDPSQVESPKQIADQGVEISQLLTPPKQARPRSRQFVNADRLNVRALPDQTSVKVGQLLRGSDVTVLVVREGWAKIHSQDLNLTGWVSSNFLSSKLSPQLSNASRKSDASIGASKPEKAVLQAPLRPVPDRDVIVRKIIAQSILSYGGRCPCPYNVMRNGRSCGQRSAYSRPGGASPLCYPSDVTPEMVEAWLSR